MQIVKNKDSFANLCFYIGLTILAVVMIIGYSVWDVPYMGRCLQLAFGLFCIKILLTYYSKSEWMAMILVGGLGCLSYLFTSDEYVVSVAVMIFAAKSVDIKKAMKVLLWSALGFVVLMAMLSFMGIGGLAVDIRDYGRGSIEARWCLGFNHANNLHGTFWYLISILIYVYFEKLKWKHYIGLTFLNVLLFFLTVSKAGVISAQIVICAAWLFSYVPQIRNSALLYGCGVIGLIVIQIISVVSAMVSINDSKLLALLDRFMTGRIQFALQLAPFTNWRWLSAGGELSGVDNGWVVVPYSYGMIIGILYILVHGYLIFIAYKRSNLLYLAMIMTSILYIFMESTYMINSSYILSNLTYVTAMIMIGEKRHEST